MWSLLDFASLWLLHFEATSLCLLTSNCGRKLEERKGEERKREREEGREEERKEEEEEGKRL